MLFFYLLDDEFPAAKMKISGKQMKHQIETEGELNRLCQSSQHPNKPQSVNNWYDASPRQGQEQENIPSS